MIFQVNTDNARNMISYERRKIGKEGQRILQVIVRGHAVEIKRTGLKAEVSCAGTNDVTGETLRLKQLFEVVLPDFRVSSLLKKLGF